MKSHAGTSAPVRSFGSMTQLREGAMNMPLSVVLNAFHDKLYISIAPCGRIDEIGVVCIFPRGTVNI